MMGNLFQPFVRGKATNEQGLGLGLYIASEIAKMHQRQGRSRLDATGNALCLSHAAEARLITTRSNAPGDLSSHPAV